MNAPIPVNAGSPFYTAEHEEFRTQVRRFVEREILPNLERWEDEGELPRELHRRAAEAGVLAIGFPEEYGGVETPDPFYAAIQTEELARTGSAGLFGSLTTHNIACPPIVHAGTPEQKERYLRPVLEGLKIPALAITEPCGGSDVAQLQTRAERDGDHYVVNGSKTFITSGMRADIIVTAVRTGGPGLSGISLLVIEGDTPGLSRTRLEKMGCRCSDTATLYFDGCRVPVANRLGSEDSGFKAIMRNFNGERLAIIHQARGLAQVCYDEALAYARERRSFGRPLIDNQVIRHKLLDMKMQIDAIKAQSELLCWRVAQGEAPAADLSLLKVLSTRVLEEVAGEAVQIFGGAGYLRGCKVERIFRETKVLSIGGGASEVMLDLAARQLGY